MVSKEEDGRSNPLKNSAKVSFLAFPPQETLPQKGDPANFKNSWRRRAVKPPFPILHSGTGRNKKLFPFPLWRGKKRWAHHFRRCCYATRRQSFAHLVVFSLLFSLNPTAAGWETKEEWQKFFLCFYSHYFSSSKSGGGAWP